ncbi:cell division protein FtsQ/DivIB [Sneathiella sp.]|uniref:cell division protein FtsQ/DivIB n=1 Tax=Sneathiella sp. TaxID=1964365 RepID=UPI0035684F6B
MRPLTVDRNDRLNMPKRNRKSSGWSGIFKGFGHGTKKTKKRAAPRKAEPRLSPLTSLARLGKITVQFGDRVGAAMPTRKAKTTSRRKPVAGWRKPALICAGVLLVAIIIGGASNFLIREEVMQKTSDWIDEKQQALATAFGLTVQEISIVGRDKAVSQDILRALDVKRGDSILGVDPEEARERLETLGWIETASVMRRFPDELFIEIKERRPFARWQIGGRTGVIDRTGAVVTEHEDTEFSYLPKVVGPGANTHAAELFDMLSQTPELFTRVQNAVRIRDRRWNLEFDNKVTVLLPEKGTLQAWKQLYDIQTDQHILEKGVVAIDLRADDRMYVRLKSEAAKLRRVAGSET